MCVTMSTPWSPHARLTGHGEGQAWQGSRLNDLTCITSQDKERDKRSKQADRERGSERDKSRWADGGCPMAAVGRVC